MDHKFMRYRQLNALNHNGERKITVRMITVFAAVLLSLHGCTGRQPDRGGEKQEVPTQRTKIGENVPGKGLGDGGKTIEPSKAAAVISLTEGELKSLAPKDNIPLDNLSFKATFDNVEIGPEPLEFKNGKAIVKLEQLPAERAADLTLQILAGDKPKLEAKVENVVLPADSISTVDVNLKLVGDSGGGATGSKTDTATNTGTGTDTNTGTGTGSGTRTGTGINTSTGAGTGTSSLSIWDGKSDQGNKKWKIINAN